MLEVFNDNEKLYPEDKYPDEHLCKELDERIKTINGMIRELCSRENLDVVVRVPEASGSDFKKFFQIRVEVNRIESLL